MTSLWKALSKSREVPKGAHLVASLEVKTQDLASTFPAQLNNPNKQSLYDLVQKEKVRDVVMSFHRYEADSREETLKPELLSTVIDRVEGTFCYKKSEAGWVDFHVNFADADLFRFYGSDLYAQDEHQVSEHPVLGSLLELLKSDRLDASCVLGSDGGYQLEPRTVKTNGDPTPIVILNVPRQV